jgi:hypothetical protein
VWWFSDLFYNTVNIQEYVASNRIINE